MASFRARFKELQEADRARTQLVEDLLQKVDDMEKTMDRNAFVLVLIDGDGMNFLDDLVRNGIAGGEEASQRLRREVFNELRNDPDFRHDHKIVIKVYANMRGLSKLYTQYGLISKGEDFAEFVLGFNKSHPLCDFVDSGNHKESADKKIQETLNLYVYNVHCKHIIFGASADNSYASFLGSFHDIDIATRIRLLEGPPFAAEFKTILPRFKQVIFPTIFRNSKIDITKAHFSTPNPKRKSGIIDDTAVKSAIPFRSAPIERHLIDDTTFRAGRPPPPSTPYPKLQRPASPTKNISDVTNGGVSLRSETTPQPSPKRRTAKLASGPTMEDVDSALILATVTVLKETPRSCDFSNIKRRAAQVLGVDLNFLGTSEEDALFNRCKTIIKWTVEQWVEFTDNPLPGNATWMFKHFPAGKSTAAVLRSPQAKSWRIPAEEGWSDSFSIAISMLDD